MKTKNFWFAIALCVVLPFVFASCEKEPRGDPDVPAVEKSEILNDGIGSVTATTPAFGTVLSYESWVNVRQTFKNGESPKDNRVSVVVKDTINTVSKDIEVWAYDLWEYQTSVSYERLGSHKNGYVTVYDSVMIYRVNYTGFSYEYELRYQVPVYNDGYLTYVMPHHRFENIVSADNATLTDQSPKEVDGTPYAVKLYKHSIKASFGGKEYEFKANINLLRKLANPGEKYVVKSEVVSTSINKMPNGSGFNSLITTKQTWSDNSQTTTNRKAELVAEGRTVVAPEVSVSGKFDNFTFSKISLTKGTEREWLPSGDDYIKIDRYTDIVNVEYNFFTVSIPFSYMKASYDDKTLQTDLLHHEYDVEKIAVSDSQMIFIERQGNSEYYTFQLEVEATLGNASGGTIKVIGRYSSVVVFNY